MAFMQPEITAEQNWIEIDGDMGCTFLPSDVDGKLYKLINNDNPTDDEMEQMLVDAATYYEGHVESVGITIGYGARMTAPGYMDCTEWTVFSTEQAASSFLDEYYAEDMEA